MKFRSVSFRYNYRDDDACNIFYSCINLAHVKSDDENYRTLWIMTTKMHSTAKILKFATLPLISAIFIDIYYQSLRMVGASVGYMLKPPFVDLNRRQNIWIKCKKVGCYIIRMIHLVCQFSWQPPWEYWQVFLGHQPLKYTEF